MVSRRTRTPSPDTPAEMSPPPPPPPPPRLPRLAIPLHPPPIDNQWTYTSSPKNYNSSASSSMSSAMRQFTHINEFQALDGRAYGRLSNQPSLPSSSSEDAEAATALYSMRSSTRNSIDQQYVPAFAPPTWQCANHSRTLPCPCTPHGGEIHLGRPPLGGISPARPQVGDIHPDRRQLGGISPVRRQLGDVPPVRRQLGDVHSFRPQLGGIPYRVPNRVHDGVSRERNGHPPNRFAPPQLPITALALSQRMRDHREAPSQQPAPRVEPETRNNAEPTSAKLVCHEPDPCDNANLRKCLSHFFGRNKSETKRIPLEAWIHVCRKHYQRRRYNSNKEHEFWKIQAPQLRKQIDMFERFMGTITWRIQWTSDLRKRLQEHHRARAMSDNYDADSEIMCASNLDPFTGQDKNTSDVLFFIENMERLCHSGAMDALLKVEFLPSRFGRQ